MKKRLVKIDHSAPILEVDGAKYVKDAAGCYVPAEKIRADGIIHKPEDILPLFSELRLSEVEQVWCADLDGAHQVIGIRTVTVGLVNQCSIHPREIFRGAILNNAVAVFLAHNHPSGSLQASREDIAATKKVAEAGRLIGITVLDHLIVTPRGHVTLRGTHPELF